MDAPADAPADALRILVVCTANQCRSPLAAALLRSRLQDVGVAAAVESAGVLEGGRPATSDGVAVLRDRGIDPGEHVSRSLRDGSVDVAAADLVLGMERKHVQEAIVTAPSVQHRAFTLVDLVRRAEAAEPRRVAEGETVREWAARLAAGRRRADLLGRGDDGVADPIGQGREAYERTADLLDDLLGRLLERAFPDRARAVA